MFLRKISLSSVLLGAFALSLSAQADTKRYIVQFKSAATFESVSRAATANRQVAPGVMAPMHLLGSESVIAKPLDNVKLLIISSDNAAAVESLRNHPAIALIEEEIFHPAPAPISTWGADSASILKKASKSAPAKLNIDRPWGIDAVKAPAAWNTTKGSGARVMVLDTGLDTEHPAIAANFEAGKNFTSDDESDITDNVGHGTHVSGTILAVGAQGGLVGVAPEAKLLMGKVCEIKGCSSIAIADGINWAVTEKVDVVSMSLGGAYISSAELTALKAAEANGIFVVAASGNDSVGKVGYPAAVDTVTAVGAVDEKLVKAEFSNWGPELDVVAPGVDVISSVPRGTGRAATVQMDLDGKGQAATKSLPVVGSPVATFAGDLVNCGLGKPEEFANVSGKIALIQRGEIAFKDKVANAITAGAAGVIIFNNADGMIQGTLGDDGKEVAIPVAMIEQVVGNAAKALLASGQEVKGTIQIDRTDYASMMGTSMATPHTAGVAALIRAANKNLTPAQVRDLLKSTATPLSPNDENQYGAGMINAEAAVAQAKSMASEVRQFTN